VPPGRLPRIRLNPGAKLAEEVGATDIHRKLPFCLVNLFIDEGNPYGRNIQAGLADRIGSTGVCPVIATSSF
jgi:hypothetical protein